ncbi:MAG: helix-turn-helix domain-containing protein [Oscillospiraceae bacterium]|nr:helix-turn-helix domain-containing protein [Oscillospiraceae bacterium]
MLNEIFSNNLRRLRIDKKLTQEQLASTLGVSVQSVSRWECGNTLPDVMLLPEIAQLYGVTVDDLYRQEAAAYSNYANRLFAVYESSRRSEDFLAAEQEFARTAAILTPEDLRIWGILYHYMAKHCAELAQQKLQQAMAHPDVSEEVFCSSAQQRIALMCDLGKGLEIAEQYELELNKTPSDAKWWLLSTAAWYFVKDYKKALTVATEGLNRFPEHALLHTYAGDALCNLKQYDDAFIHWREALSLDSSALDAAFSMGFCYESLQQYDKAYKVWTEIVKELDRRGLVVERDYPAKLAENCLKRMG